MTTLTGSQPTRSKVKAHRLVEMFLVRVISFICANFGPAGAGLFKQGIELESSPKLVHNKIRDMVLTLLKKEI